MTRQRNRDSQYNPFAFHFIRISQLLSSAIVCSILGYFIHHLSVELFTVPWTFILLITVSVLTIISFLATVTFYHQRTLRPNLSVGINGFLTLLWMLGFALLAWNVSGTLRHQCNTENWGNEAGVMVCRLYKALMAFSTTGLLSTIAALILDIRVRRQFHTRGGYGNMEKHGAPGMWSDNMDDQDHSLDYLEHSQESKKPYRVQRPIEGKDFGYSTPSEQTSYGGDEAIQLHGGYNDGH